MNTKPLIYLAFANDRSGDECFLEKLKNERRGIPTALQKAVLEGLCETHTEPDATIDDLFSDFIKPDFQHRITVFHYAGHASGAGWHLEGADGIANSLAHADGTARLLAALTNLQLVFLNGCNTEDQIAMMRQNGIKNIIATAVSIDDEAAVNFATAFYQALGECKTIDDAFEWAQNRAMAQYGGNLRGTWKLPPAEVAQPTFPWLKNFSTPNWSLPKAIVGEKLNLDIFIAYAKEDSTEADRLGKFLKILKRQGLVNTYSMHNIQDRQAGGETEKEIKRQLLNAKIILLLISTDFLTDDFCNEIEDIAMQRHYDQAATVIPVWLKTTETSGFGFTKIQGLPYNGKATDTWSDKDTVFTEITKGIKQVAEKFGKA